MPSINPKTADATSESRTDFTTDVDFSFQVQRTSQQGNFRALQERRHAQLWSTPDVRELTPEAAQDFAAARSFLADFYSARGLKFRQLGDPFLYTSLNTALGISLPELRSPGMNYERDKPVNVRRGFWVHELVHSTGFLRYGAGRDSDKESGWRARPAQNGCILNSRAKGPLYSLFEEYAACVPQCAYQRSIGMPECQIQAPLCLEVSTDRVASEKLFRLHLELTDPDRFAKLREVKSSGKWAHALWQYHSPYVTVDTPYVCWEGKDPTNGGTYAALPLLDTLATEIFSDASPDDAAERFRNCVLRAQNSGELAELSGLIRNAFGVRALEFFSLLSPYSDHDNASLAMFIQAKELGDRARSFREELVETWLEAWHDERTKAPTLARELERLDFQIQSPYQLGDVSDQARQSERFVSLAREAFVKALQSDDFNLAAHIETKTGLRLYDGQPVNEKKLLEVARDVVATGCVSKLTELAAMVHRDPYELVSKPECYVILRPVLIQALQERQIQIVSEIARSNLSLTDLFSSDEVLDAARHVLDEPLPNLRAQRFIANFILETFPVLAPERANPPQLAPQLVHPNSESPKFS